MKTDQDLIVKKRTAKWRDAVEESRWAVKQYERVHDELQQTQMKLIQVAKMETLGRFAAGVAHEVKNPLMTLGMGVDYFSQRETTDPDEAVLLQDMKTSIQRADNIINLMLEFSKPHPLKLAPENMNEVIENALRLVHHQLQKQRIKVVTELDQDLPPISIDLTRMEHVLVNLYTNAAQAMGDGGTLTVRTYANEAPDSAAPDEPSQIILEIDDTGPGLPEDNIPKAFEPFFTTKPPGQGTGLGLAIVHQIVQVHGGNVTLANRPEGGARATVKFNF